MSVSGLCAEHNAVASYRCGGCGKWLCYDCVEEIDSRFLAGAASCKYCGEKAIAVEDVTAIEAAKPADFEAAEADARRAVPDLLYTPAPEPAAGDLTAAFGPSTRDHDATPAFLLFAHHAVVPAATIAMVTALLFFLLDLRSIYLGESDALKWLGFWFVTATVLIARYGKMSSYDTERDRQGCYTLALAVATVCVLLSSPWEDSRDGWSGPVISSLIFLAVWRFATRLTAGLSLEGEEWWPDEPRLYGLERLAVEELGRQRRDRSILRLSKPPPAAGRNDKQRPQNPSVVVARLAAVALLVFAVSEPLVLSAPPIIGARGASAMVLFLFATGVVLGAASSVAGYRRVRASGGRASVGVIPGRLAASAGLMAVILAIASTLPGIEIHGSGERRPLSTPPVTEDASQTESRTDDPVESEKKISRQGSPASSLLEALSAVGRLLRIPFLLAVAAIAGLGIWRLWPLLANMRKKLGADLSGWWARLAALLGAWLGGRRKPAAPPADPLHGLDSLRAMAPRDAVLGAYGRLLSYFEQAGYPRLERQTPHEFLSSARRRFRDVARPVARLTEAYVEAAYSNAEIDAVIRREAIAALTELLSTGPLTLRGPDAPYPSSREGETVS